MLIGSKYETSLVNYILKGQSNSMRKKLSRELFHILANQTGKKDIDVLRLLRDNSGEPISHRISDRINNVFKFINTNNNNAYIHKYLDFGCGNGEITAAIGEKLGLNSADIIGVDINTITTNRFTFINSTNDTSLLTQYYDKIDLITAMVSLHHVNNIHNCIHEISKLLVVGGHFIVREHDVDPEDALTRAYLDVIHAYISVSKKDIIDVDEINSITYYSLGTLNNIIIDHGFRLVSKYSYHEPNPQRLYYAYYMKVVV